MIHLHCPRCKFPLLSSRATHGWRCTNSICQMSTSEFPVVDTVPVLIDFENSIVLREQVLANRASSPVKRRVGWAQKLKKSLLRTEGPTEANATRFLSELKATYAHPIILVIGGGEIGNGAQALYSDPDVTVFGTDIYKSELTHFVSDGHQLPLADSSVHGVWIQAVLEHVLTPSDVVAEIYRVLSPGGLVYAETPFMQQVHEAAYDFTRFTPSGHRWLFRRFEEIEAGITRGPGTALLWSIRYFSAGIFKSSKFGLVTALLFFWLKHFDRVSSKRHSYDGPSGSFFLGKKSSRSLMPRDMLSYYRGAQ
ncbi:hypothetical protein AA309_08635 [Microvirga vignae]|uniref:Methyltransferase type 11 domain-containing protein n=2 Tax=Microvirga vignae TaxID=1225564 RepID=A0A0H1REA5_9HYPH|nr:hypothetical protein AA309_08635 [Microvirga vignae]